MKLATTIVAVLVIAGVVLIVDHLRSTNASGAQLTQNTAATTSQSGTAGSSTATPSTSGQSSTGTSSSSGNSSTTGSSSSGYKDGTYSASSDYFVPHGSESITVKLTLKGGVVSDVSINNSENDGESAAYQEQFASEYKSYIVGKKISGLQIGVVAGASDTAQGFNDALSQITSKAQS